MSSEDAESLSDELAYLSEVCAKYGVDEVRLVAFKEKMLDGFTSEDLASLEAAYCEIERRGDVEKLNEYIDSQGPKWHSLQMLLFVFSGLADRGVQPFTSRTVSKSSHWRPYDVDRATVPEQLLPFIDFVREWGVTTSDTARYRLAEEVQDDEAKQRSLQEFLDSWTPELGELYRDWADVEDISKNQISAQFYFTFLLIDELGIKPRNPRQVDRLEEAMKELAACGSERKDSERMWAARELPDFGEEAKVAIPLLETALEDPVPSVRIWAHVALARLVGDESRHREAIRQVGEEFAGELDDDFENESLARDVDAALDVLNRTPEEHNVEALRGFCIMNDVKHVRRLAPITELDRLDHNGQRALEYAVEGNHPASTEILLEHGADANLLTQRGYSCLHLAATLHDGGEMIKLLVEHGCQVNGRDQDRSTPLDWALEHGRDSNAEVLRQLGGKCSWRDWSHAQRACAWTVRRTFRTRRD